MTNLEFQYYYVEDGILSPLIVSYVLAVRLFGNMFNEWMVILSQGTFSFAGAKGYAQQLVYIVDLLRKGLHL